MPDLWNTFSDDKKKEVEGYLLDRFNFFNDQRQSFDTDMQEDVDVYNNVDKNIQAKQSWEEKVKIPYIYTIVQTAVSRVIKSIFGRDNWLKVYLEGPAYNSKIENDLALCLQSELDRLKIKDRARDFIEESAVKRTAWLHIRTFTKVEQKKEKTIVDFDIFDWFNVWFDTRARQVEDTDYFIRKFRRFYKLQELAEKVYFNLDRVKGSRPPQDINQEEEYRAKHSSTERNISYTEDSKTDLVELLEWYGVYNTAEKDQEEKWEECIFVVANRQVLVRAELNTMPTRRKRLLFPIRLLRQANSLVGKSIPQIVRDQQYELNEIRSLRQQNAKLLAKLLFKYNKSAQIDWAELLPTGGNCIGFDGNPDDVQIFQIPNLIQALTYVAQDIMSNMQAVTGAVDYVMGTDVARPSGETATTSRLMTEQAMFKFGMMVDNINGDFTDFIHYLLIIKIIYDRESILSRFQSLKNFVDQPVSLLEDERPFDIAIVDLSQRRDVERSQFINASNIVGSLLGQTNGNMREFLREVMSKLQMDNIDAIMQPDDAFKQTQQLMQAIQANPMLGQIMSVLVQDPKAAQQIMMMMGAAQAQAAPGAAQGGAQRSVAQQTPKQTMPEEEAGQVNTEKVRP